MAGSDNLRPDLCILGGGTAGSMAALAAIGLGLSCVLVEKTMPMGRSQARELALDMLIAAPAGEGFEAVRARIGEAVAGFGPTFAAERLRAAGVTVLHGQGRFTGRHTAQVGASAIQARRFVLATGGRPMASRIAGIELVRPLTPATLFTLDERPTHLAILGAGRHAHELAQAFRRFGSAVTVVADGAPVDPELWEPVRAALIRDGVERRAGPVQRIEPSGSGALLLLADGKPAVEASHLLLVEEQQPFLESLGLDSAGIRTNDSGLVLRPDLRTTNARVFAVGEVAGPWSSGTAGIPAEIGTVLRAAFFRQAVRHTPGHVPRVMRTRPPVADVGQSEADARRHAGRLRVFRAPFSDNERALAMQAPEGEVKILATASGRLLGAGIVGGHAAELIAPWALALAHKLPVDAVATLPMAHPSLSDMSRKAALASVAIRLRGVWVKRMLGAIKLLG